jgi:hypothetical protein
MTPAERRGVVYLMVCAAPPARDALVLVELAQQAGWEVCVIATPNARRFIDPPALEAATGHPVRFDYKQPDEPDELPPPDAIVVAPATFNTLNKWAAGIKPGRYTIPSVLAGTLGILADRDKREGDPDPTARSSRSLQGPPAAEVTIERGEPGGWQPGLLVGRGVDRGEQTLDGGGVRLHGAVDQDRRGGVDPAL